MTMNSPAIIRKMVIEVAEVPGKVSHSAAVMLAARPRSANM